jgi:hypothetical protein
MASASRIVFERWALSFPLAASADALERTVEHPILLVDHLSEASFGELIVAPYVVLRRLPMTDRRRHHMTTLYFGATLGFRRVHNNDRDCKHNDTDDNRAHSPLVIDLGGNNFDIISPLRSLGGPLLH